jgi:hypothetical protein
VVRAHPTVPLFSGLAFPPKFWFFPAHYACVKEIPHRTSRYGWYLPEASALLVFGVDGTFHSAIMASGQGASTFYTPAYKSPGPAFSF